MIQCWPLISLIRWKSKKKLDSPSRDYWAELRLSKRLKLVEEAEEKVEEAEGGAEVAVEGGSRVSLTVVPLCVWIHQSMRLDMEENDVKLQNTLLRRWPAYWNIFRNISVFKKKLFCTKVVSFCFHTELHFVSLHFKKKNGIRSQYVTLVRF